MRFISLTSIIILAILLCIPVTAVPTLSGRVYDGLFGDESTPAPGMTISCYCAPQAQDPMVMSPYGPLIGQSVTDATGYWEIPANQACNYYLIIISSSPDPHSWEGASSVDGKVLDPQMIEYSGPLAGKTLTGNKFWYRTERFSGRVFKGYAVDESIPLAGIDISCHCAMAPVDPDPAAPLILGAPVGHTQTDPSGYWEIFPVSGCSPLYVITADIPVGSPLFAAGARSVDGDVVRPNVIQYGDITGYYPLQGKVLTGNKFWFSDALPPVSPIPSQPSPQTPGQAASPSPDQGTPPVPGEPEHHTGAIITGRVFQGPPGPDELPMEGVFVELFCSANPEQTGDSIAMVETDTQGIYELVVTEVCGFYTITAFPEGDVIMAQAPGGEIIDGNRIRIPSPLEEHALHENNFWVETAVTPLEWEPAPQEEAPTQPWMEITMIYIGIVALVILAVIAFLLIEKRKSQEHGKE